MARRRIGQADITEVRGILSGSSVAMTQLRRTVVAYAPYTVPVIIQGPTGSGKELTARAIHAASPRARRSYVTVNCATLQPNLAASTLFGHTKGGFTGANAIRRGLFAEADKGTLFLDEVAELDLEVQAMLLRVLETGEIRSVGADKGREVDVRVIVATHQPLQDLVAQGRFREDLYFRLAVAEIDVPSLAQRRGDIPRLAQLLLDGAQRYGIRARGFDADAMIALKAASWPGNVRQLRNVVMRSAIFAAGGVIELADVRRALGADATARRSGLTRKVRRDEAAEIQAALDAASGSKTAAARTLGISRSTLYERMKRFGVEA
jgi:two-component system response regulator GlrR